MNTKTCKWATTVIAAIIACLVNCQGALATAFAIEPFLCASSDGSIVIWESVQGHNAIAVTVRHRNDMGGGKFKNLSGVKGNSVVSVIPIINTTSSNVQVRLAVLTNTNVVLMVPPTSTAGGTYTWNLASYGLNSSQTIEKMAVFASNVTGNPGTIFFRHFVINGTHITGQITATSGCLTY